MKNDINEVNHKFIIRVVLFALFLYKDKMRQNLIYNNLVSSFVKKRLPWDIGIKIENDSRNKSEVRSDILRDILNDTDDSKVSLVTVSFRTPLEIVNMSVDLSKEEEYKKFVYM